MCIRAQTHTVLLLHMYLISMIIRETQCRQVLLVIRAYLPLVCRSYKETCSSDLAAQNHVEHSSGSSAFIKEPGSRQTSSALSHFLSLSFTWRKHIPGNLHPALFKDHICIFHYHLSTPRSSADAEHHV